MNKMILRFKGYDDWSRPVYEAEGRLYVDVAPLKNRHPDICTKSDNDFWGEPDSTVSNVELEFIPFRVTWD